MDADRVDRFTRTVARLTSRRAALRTMGAGLAAALGSNLGFKAAADAQESTPGVSEPTDASAKILTMFVQTAQSGQFLPKPGEAGVYQLVLRGASAQTVHFSDRPQRLVGSVSTADFLAGLGFSPENPPNAAIVAQTEVDGEDVLVVELLNPDYDSGSQTLTYDVIVLDEYAGDGFGDLAHRPDDDVLSETFGPASLFIDDCPDLTMCVNDVDRENGYRQWSAPIPNGPYRQEWRDGLLGCQPVDANGEQLLKGQLANRCSQAYPDHCPNFGYWYGCDPR